MGWTGRAGDVHATVDVVAYIAAPIADTDPTVAEQQAEIFDHVAGLDAQVVETVIDHPRIGARGLPPGLRSLLAGVRLGAVSAVVTSSLGRMVRSSADMFVVRSTFAATDTRLILIRDQVDTGNDESAAQWDRIVGLLAGQGQSERVHRERERALRGDAKRTSSRVYGFDSTWIGVVDEEAAVVRQCAVRVLAGESLRTVVDDLNQRGVPSPSGKGPWSPAGLRALLVNPRMWGWRSYHGEPIARGAWPAILDQPTGDRLIRLLSGRRQRHAGDRAGIALLDGIVRCASCGAVMVTRHADPQRYECPRPPAGCGSVGVGVALLDDHVSEAVFTEVTVGARLDLLAAHCRTEFSDAADARWRLAQNYRSRSDLVRRIRDGDVGPDDVTAELAELDRDKARIDRALGYLRLARFSPAQRRSERMMASLHELSTTRKSALIRLFVDDVMVSPTSRARGFDRGRVEMVWRDVDEPFQDMGPLRSIAR